MQGAPAQGKIPNEGKGKGKEKGGRGKGKSKTKIEVKTGPLLTHEQITWLILGISFTIAAVLLVLYILSVVSSGFYGSNIDLLSWIVIVIAGPYGCYVSWRLNRIDKYEAKFSEFLRDLAEYWKVGLSMTAAVNTIAQGEYGALNKEVKRMAGQISWGIAFNEVLEDLARRIGTPLVVRSISLVREANNAGGKISDVMLTAAEDASEITFLKEERKRNIKMYIIVIMISFLVYLAVILILVALFLPAIVESSKSMAGETMAGMEVAELSMDQLVFIFYLSVLVQSIGNGLMAGLMSRGKLQAGALYVTIFMLMGWGAFLLVQYIA